jgi:hypothetical protein
LRWVAKVGYFLIKTSFSKNFTPAPINIIPEFIPSFI